MTSRRNNAYLEATRDCILDVGLKRTTLTEVARRAGVSRMTIYRTWPDMESLLADLMTREWGTVLGGVLATRGEEPTPRNIADGLVAAIVALRDNPLLRRILDLDPEVLLPYLLDRPGRVQEAVLAALAPRIEEGQDAGLLRSGDPRTLTRVLLLTAHGFTLSLHTMTDDSHSERDLLDTLADILAAGLTP